MGFPFVLRITKDSWANITTEHYRGSTGGSNTTVICLCILQNQHEPSVYFVAAVFVLYWNAFSSDSGAGWLAFTISLAFILVSWRRWLLLVFLPIGGLLIAAAMIFYNKISSLRATFSTSSLNIRLVLWENTLKLLKGKTAVTGLGLEPGFRYTPIITVSHCLTYTTLICSFIVTLAYSDLLQWY